MASLMPLDPSYEWQKWSQDPDNTIDCIWPGVRERSIFTAGWNRREETQVKRSEDAVREILTARLAGLDLNDGERDSLVSDLARALIDDPNEAKPVEDPIEDYLIAKYTNPRNFDRAHQLVMTAEEIDAIEAGVRASTHVDWDDSWVESSMLCPRHHTGPHLVTDLRRSAEIARVEGEVETPEDPFYGYLYYRSDETKRVGSVDRTEEVSPGVLLDYDADGVLLGIEVLAPSFLTSKA